MSDERRFSELCATIWEDEQGVVHQTIVRVEEPRRIVSQPIYVDQMLEPIAYTGTMEQFGTLVRKAGEHAAAREHPLHVPTRECPICQGSGYVTENEYDEDGEVIGWDDYRCWRCDGHGIIPEEDHGER